MRNITVQQAGFGPTAVRVSATVWPSHKNVPLKKGDVVAFEGSYEQRKSTGDDGEGRTFHNISVLRLTVLGSVSEGSESGGGSKASADVEEVNDDDIPF